MRVHDPARDREPEADASTVGRAPLPEAVEETLELVWRDPRAGILDLEDDAVGGGPGAYDHVA